MACEACCCCAVIGILRNSLYLSLEREYLRFPDNGELTRWWLSETGIGLDQLIGQEVVGCGNNTNIQGRAHERFQRDY